MLPSFDELEEARRDYRFRFEPQIHDRCESCTRLDRDTRVTQCALLGINIKEPHCSRCPLYTERVPRPGHYWAWLALVDGSTRWWIVRVAEGLDGHLYWRQIDGLSSIPIERLRGVPLRRIPVPEPPAEEA